MMRLNVGTCLNIFVTNSTEVVYRVITVLALGTERKGSQLGKDFQMEFHFVSIWGNFFSFRESSAVRSYSIFQLLLPGGVLGTQWSWVLKSLGNSTLVAVGLLPHLTRNFGFASHPSQQLMLGDIPSLFEVAVSGLSGFPQGQKQGTNLFAPSSP